MFALRRFDARSTVLRGIIWASDAPRRRRRFALIAAALTIPVLAWSGPGPSTSAMINQQLDSQQSLVLDATLPEVMKQVGNQTGVRLVADPVVWDLLPWGDQTTVKAKIENHTLREEITAITRRLGLDFATTDEAIEIRPVPALRRLGRRATVGEIEVLDLLAASPMNLPVDKLPATAVLAAVDKRLVDLKSSFAVDDRASGGARETVVTVPRNATVAGALEAIADQTNATWYPSGGSLIVVPKEQQVRTQLNKVLSARYTAVDVGQVVLELSQRAGVPITPEPGVYQKVPPADRSITLLLDNATIRQALDTIGGHTGLSFDVTDAGVKVTYSGTDAEAATKPVK